MPRIQHTPTSRRDAVAILTYLRSRSRQGARAGRHALFRTLTFLSENLGAGRTREELLGGLRNYPVDRYRHDVIFYRPLSDGNVVLRILHGARDLPRHF